MMTTTTFVGRGGGQEPATRGVRVRVRVSVWVSGFEFGVWVLGGVSKVMA